MHEGDVSRDRIHDLFWEFGCGYLQPVIVEPLGLKGDIHLPNTPTTVTSRRQRRPGLQALSGVFTSTMAPRSLLWGAPRYVCRTCSRRTSLQARRTFASKTRDVYDVVCVGGGPAGLSLLAALRESYTGSATETVRSNRDSQAQTPSHPTFALPSSKPKISPKPRRSPSRRHSSRIDAALLHHLRHTTSTR